MHSTPPIFNPAAAIKFCDGCLIVFSCACWFNIYVKHFATSQGAFDSPFITAEIQKGMSARIARKATSNCSILL